MNDVFKFFLVLYFRNLQSTNKQTKEIKKVLDDREVFLRKNKSEINKTNFRVKVCRKPTENFFLMSMLYPFHILAQLNISIQKKT